MTAVIDGDSSIFMLGYVHREHQDTNEMFKSVDIFLENLFIQTGATQYYGAVAGSSKCFRYNTYKVKPYKGNRSEQADHMNFWRPVVSSYLIDHWKFDTPGVLAYEADDFVFAASSGLKAEGIPHIICSPDKDLRAIPGMHYDYRKNEFCQIDEHQALYNFFYLMIAGDDTDNIAGIPGQGDKKAQEKLKPLLIAKADRTSYEELVRSLYHRHFGEYYGNIIYKETYETISLVQNPLREIQIHSVPQRIHPLDMV